MKSRKIFVFFLLLTCCNVTMLFSQDYDTNKSKESRYLDTLRLEYEGPLQEYTRIIERVLPSYYALPGKRNNEINDGGPNFPLVISYKERISSLAQDYLKKNAKITKGIDLFDKNKHPNNYELHNGLTSFSDFLTPAGYNIANYYMEIFMRFKCNVHLREFLEKPFSIENDLKDENFANLVLEASKTGIKSVATVSGFYDKELAIKLARGILYNKIKNLLNSNQSLAYRMVYIADTYNALKDLSDNNGGLWGEATKESMLKKMMARKNF